MAEHEVIDLSGNDVDAYLLVSDDEDDDPVLEVDGVAAPSSSSSSSRNNNKKRRRGTTPLIEVLEVFPDAKPEFVNQLLLQCANQVEVVVQHMMEQPYEKIETRNNAKHPLAAEWKPPSEIDYMSPNSFVPSGVYRLQAKNALLQAFRFLSFKQADGLLAESKFHYSIAHDRVWKALLGGGGGDGNCTTTTTTAMPLRTQLDRVLAATTRGVAPTSFDFPYPPLKKPRRSCAQMITEATLSDETDYVAQKCSHWIQQAQQQLEREANKQLAEATGTAMECLCCCDTDDVNQMVACSEAHLFCRDCLKNYATNQIFGSGNLGMDKKTKKPALALQCCYGDCPGTFSRFFLEVVLDQKALQKYDEIAFTMSVDAAGVAVHRCPRCDFAADVPETQRVFACLQCSLESCMECGEASHIPLKCEEVKKDKVATSHRVTVEEAISAAFIRKCPACKKPFIKSDGCNKMRCGCGAFSCYLCQAKISDYSHFCQVPHFTHDNPLNCNNKCPLYSKPEDDLKRMRAAATQAVTETGATDVDVEKILATTT